MNKTSVLPDLRSIPIAEIKVVNPRQRNTATHAQIIENIRAIGLKRPITVTKRAVPDGEFMYELVCGQGRLEAYLALGEKIIPAVVVDVCSEDGLVMSLIENVARAPRTGLETMREIQALRDRGHTQDRISKIIGATQSWVSGVLVLLERGEERLVAGVANGVIPISLAVRIASDDSKDLQNALAEAYETGLLRGKQLAMVRMLIKLRERHRRIQIDGGLSQVQSARWTPQRLLTVYEEEAEARRLIVKKAELIESLLRFTIEAFRTLIHDKDFTTAIRKEGLSAMPAGLVQELRQPAEATV